MNRKALEQKDHVKYLGVLLDEHLDWKHQIKNVSLKISRGIGILAKLRPFLEDKLLKNIYYSLVYSHLSYGVQAWGSADPPALNKIKVLQNKAVRILTGNQYFQIYGQPPGPLPSSEPLFKKLEILKFVDIFKLNIANFVYSTLDMESPRVFDDWFMFTHEIHDHSTRAGADIIQREYFDVGHSEPSLTLHTKGSHNNYGAKMIKVYGPILWNGIPENIQKSTSINTFKMYLKLHFLAQYNTENLLAVSNRQILDPTYKIKDIRNNGLQFTICIPPIYKIKNPRNNGLQFSIYRSYKYKVKNISTNGLKFTISRKIS